MKTYWHGKHEVVVVAKQLLYTKADSLMSLLTLDMGGKLFRMWEPDFLKYVDVRDR